MSRLLTTACLAALLCIVSATVSVTPSRPLASTTTTVHRATTTTPQPTPAPPPNKPVDKDYFLHDPPNSNKVCLHLKAGFALKFKYITGQNDQKKNVTRFVDFMNKTSINMGDSKCNATGLMATLNITFNEYYLVFDIKGNFKAQEWNITKTVIGFTYDKAEFPNYSGKDPTNQYVMVSSTESVLRNNGVGLKNQSFKCTANRTIDGFPVIVPEDLSVQLTLEDLQVQAFNFENKTSGEFSNIQECVQDNAGNKVVPIAVGAALAGLVIVVLIAYLIGRLRNRKKSSYEALS